MNKIVFVVIDLTNDKVLDVYSSAEKAKERYQDCPYYLQEFELKD